MKINRNGSRGDAGCCCGNVYFYLHMEDEDTKESNRRDDRTAKTALMVARPCFLLLLFFLLEGKIFLCHIFLVWEAFLK
jgi:hypothetical protein